MTKRFARTEILLGEDVLNKLSDAKILIVGVGGVGGYVTELLCRAGIGDITIVDGDKIDETNINRQIISLYDNIGESKVSVFKKRLIQINPDLKINAIEKFLNEEDIPSLLDNNHFDFIIDAIDSVKPKCALIRESINRGIGIISSMGAGARMDAGKVKLDKLSHTHHDGLSKAVRRGINDKNIANKLEVVFSEEVPIMDKQESIDKGQKKAIGTISYMPTVFGCYIAQYVINQLISSR